MGIVTSLQIIKYYDRYRDTELVFTKEMVKTLRLDPRQIYVKCVDSQWPCIINSTSFMAAKIIINAKGAACECLSKEAGNVNLHFYFLQPDGQPINFFVTTRVTSILPHSKAEDLAVVTLSFTQRPPDDLIEIVGRALEADACFVQKKDETIVLTDEVKRKIGLSHDETHVSIQNIPRRCILREISFSGAKILLLGLSQFLEKKEAVLSIEFDEPSEVIPVKGVVVRCEPVQGRKDINAAYIKFFEDSVPMAYKLHVSGYLSALRKRESQKLPASSYSGMPLG